MVINGNVVLDMDRFHISMSPTLMTGELTRMRPHTILMGCSGPGMVARFTAIAIDFDQT